MSVSRAASRQVFESPSELILCFLVRPECGERRVMNIRSISFPCAMTCKWGVHQDQAELTMTYPADKVSDFGGSSSSGGPSCSLKHLKRQLVTEEF